MDASPEEGGPDPSFIDGSQAQNAAAVSSNNPFPSFSEDDLKVVQDSLKLAQALTNKKGCDEALKGYGIPRLAALLKGLNPSGPNTNLFDARPSTLPIMDKGKLITIAQYAKNYKESTGAFVPSIVGPAGGNVTFLSHYFFSPPNPSWAAQQRAIILLHEAVHQIGGKGDKPFGGSKSLSDKIIQGCYPALKGKLGGVG